MMGEIKTERRVAEILVSRRRKGEVPADAPRWKLAGVVCTKRGISSS